MRGRGQVASFRAEERSPHRRGGGLLAAPARRVDGRPEGQARRCLPSVAPHCGRWVARLGRAVGESGACPRPALAALRAGRPPVRAGPARSSPGRHELPGPEGGPGAAGRLSLPGPGGRTGRGVACGGCAGWRGGLGAASGPAGEGAMPLAVAGGGLGWRRLRGAGTVSGSSCGPETACPGPAAHWLPLAPARVSDGRKAARQRGKCPPQSPRQRGEAGLV
ncbi:hypothetical protein HRbin26_00822 [bacterium HR26]|nr:hypothetical protein HRbin26_00822 [bacterium HR26]